ncbi:MAG: YerC/YecD family TrpR-related protein [bacterium]|nr:YerC/YecD family TrpR-related protein [bacterium]
MAKWDNKITEDLFKAVLALRDIKEAKLFFRDLLTEAEIFEFSKRWQAAQMLDENITYTEIKQATGLSSRTIARIAKWLNKGMGGYKLILNRIGHQHNPSFEKRLC